LNFANEASDRKECVQKAQGFTLQVVVSASQLGQSSSLSQPCSFQIFNSNCEAMKDLKWEKTHNLTTASQKCNILENQYSFCLAEQ